MKKSQIASLLLVAVMLIIAIYTGVSVYTKKNQEINTLQTEKQNMNLNLQERDSMVNELMSAFNEIEDNLKFIKEKRQQLSLETSQEGGRDQKKVIIDDIKMMNEMLEKSSEHIAQLEKKLKNSGIELSSFKKKIAALNQNIEDQNNEIVSLQRQLEEKDIMLADLSEQINVMEGELNKKADTLQLKQQVIEEKISDLNRAHVAYGTFKELRDKGVLTKDGGFLGIGKHTAIQENFADDYFTELNIQDTKTIPLFSHKAKVISEHPDSSYSFVEEDGMIAYLQIDNPEEFWKISKYAVIEVK
ncbi:hypothetical protein [Maribellus sp. YY47]|uniref:Cbp1 family collagen-binding glycoprotein adhesin n=1 Tax=Maribellus sp. YY47 TaxID=2929486 RepID=UPI00200090D3|nr:hypothetical protein [Maribellus sp. YY47]MCK3685539.1 hypothetical protein [Maribellus sp. YY47]